MKIGYVSESVDGQPSRIVPYKCIKEVVQRGNKEVVQRVNKEVVYR